MKIWDKIIFGSTCFGSAILTVMGGYYCNVNHSSIAAILLLSAGGAGMALSFQKLCSKKDGYFECTHQKEENIIELANKIMAHQQDQIQQIEEENKKQQKEIDGNPNLILQMAPIAHPQLQMAEDGKSTPKSSPKNPFVTNDIFKEDIQIVNNQN